MTRFTPAEKAGLKRMKWFQEEGRGYFMQQSTQPQTLGYGLADSPVGLLGWIYEKLLNWTDDYPWTDDEGGSELQNYRRLISAYLNSFSTHLDLHLLVLTFRPGCLRQNLLRIYEVQSKILGARCQDPDWVLLLPEGAFHHASIVSQGYGNSKFTSLMALSWFRGKYVVFESEHEKGGHFAAYECPEELVRDLRMMFGKGGPAFGIVPLHNGFKL